MKLSTSLQLGLLMLLLSGTAARAQTDEWIPVLDITLHGGNNRSLGVVDMMMPVTQNDSTMAFVDLRSVLSDQETWEGNAGGGIRHILDGPDIIVGAYGYFDVRRTENDNTFHQVTAGVEAIGENWDGRVNFYNPVGDDRKETGSVAPSASLIGHSIIFDDGRRFESAAGGYDIEGGHNLPYLPQTYAYLSHYAFDVEGGRDVTGYRTRLSSDITDWLRVGMEYRFSDTVRDDDISASARLRLPFGGTSNQKPKHTGIRARMMEPVVRDIDVVTQQTEPAWQTAERIDGSSAAKVYFVDNSAAPGGDGTMALPYDTLAAAETAAGNYDTIYILRGDGTSAGMNAGLTIDNAGQRVMGGAVPLTIDSAIMNVPASLNGLSLVAATAAPVISNAGGNGVTITASNAILAGVNIDGANGNGVDISRSGAAQAATGVTINRIAAINNTGHGIYIHASDSASASAAVSNSTATGNGGHGVVVYDDTDGTFDADLGGGALGSAGQNALHGNTREDIAVDMDGGTLSATGNYWGQAGGPVAGQIFAGAPVGDSLAAHWQLNENAGNASDRIGGNTGTLNNAPTYTPGGQMGGAIDLTLAGSQYIAVPDFAAADTGDKLTVSYWINPDSLPATMTHVSKWDEGNSAGNTSWGVRSTNADGTELFFFVADAADTGNNYFTTTDADLTAGNWTMITMVYDGAGATNADRLKVYKNGVALNGAFVGTIPASLNDSNADVAIGRQLINNPAFAQYFDGRMDDVRIYSAALTPTQVTELYRLNGNSGVNSAQALAAAP